MINKRIIELNESIKNYNEKILINQNEYRKPYQIIMKDGKETIEKGKFLEINKSNELFKNGKKTIGIIIDILDNREPDMTSDLNTFNGDVFLKVEFKNETGLNYKVKTPAISSRLYNYIKIGQKVDVYYDDSNNLDFYVTNIKGKKISNLPLITKILAYSFIVFTICILIYMLLK